MEINEKFFTGRVSVRRYETDLISEEDLRLIHKAIQCTPTSFNGQQFSVIDIADKAIKEQLYNITGQKQIKTCSHFFVFCSDYYKIDAIARSKDLELVDYQHTVDGLIVGTIDATLAMANAMVAARSRGLGTCCVGYIRTSDPLAISELLSLPQGVLIICGLAVGIPREEPDEKPKQPLEIVVHRNGYDTKQIVKCLQKYDESVADYNESRSGQKTDNDWSSHILDYYKMSMTNTVLSYIDAQGYGVGD